MFLIIKALLIFKICYEVKKRKFNKTVITDFKKSNRASTSINVNYF